MSRYGIALLLSLFAILAFTLGCVSQPQQAGALFGEVTVGPLCPVEPCIGGMNLTAIYSSLRVDARDSATGALAASAEISPAGHYSMRLPAGSYNISVAQENGQPYGIPGANAPKRIGIAAGVSAELDFDIDTGIR